MVDRLKSAALGLSFTIGLVVAIAAVHFAVIPGVFEASHGKGRDEMAWAVSVLRKDLLLFHAGVATLIAVYWGLIAVFARGEFLRIRSANITLLLSGTALALLNLIPSLAPRSNAILKGLCPLLGISDEYVTFGFDAQSSCDVFANATYLIMLVGLLGLLVVSLAISAASRIVVSRRLWRST